MARPLTRAEWNATSAKNRGGWSYERYLRWFRGRQKTVKPRPPTYDPLAPLSPGAQTTYASRVVDESLAPVRSELQRLRDQSREFYAGRAKDIQGFGLAGANLLKSTGPAVQAGYQGAAQETASMAKGYADAQAQIAAAAGQGAKGVLEAAGPVQGAPEGQAVAIDQAAGAGPGIVGGGPGADLHDVIYAQGEIPAAGMEREGAAFGAAASFLPNAMLGKTSLEMGRSAAEAKQKEDDFMAQLSELEQKRPGLINDVLKDLRDNELQKAATRINRAYLGIKREEVKADASTKAMELGLDAADVDEPLSASNGYLTNKYGQPILSNGKTVPYTKYQAPKDQSGPSGKVGKRNKALQTAREKMFNDAADWVTEKEITDVRSPKYGQKVSAPKYSYQQARQILWNKYGVPLMGYAAPGGQKALKTQINKMIDAALAQIGLRKPKKPVRRTGGKNAGRPGRRP